MHRKSLTPILLVLALMSIACNQSPRYVFLSQNVAAAGAGGANEFSTPETETIKGAVYRLDTESGKMVMVMGVAEQNEAGETGILSFRVFTTDESNAILARSRTTGSP